MGDIAPDKPRLWSLGGTVYVVSDTDEIEYSWDSSFIFGKRVKLSEGPFERNPGVVYVRSVDEYGNRSLPNNFDALSPHGERAWLAKA